MCVLGTIICRARVTRNRNLLAPNGEFLAQASLPQGHGATASIVAILRYRNLRRPVHCAAPTGLAIGNTPRGCAVAPEIRVLGHGLSDSGALFAPLSKAYERRFMGL